MYSQLGYSAFNIGNFSTSFITNNIVILIFTKNPNVDLKQKVQHFEAFSDLSLLRIIVTHLFCYNFLFSV